MQLPKTLLNSIENAVNQISEMRSQTLTRRSLLVAISGIDGSGKGLVADKLFHSLQNKGYKIALIGLDVWHNSQDIRFSPTNPAQHFYDNAFRWEQLFNSLLIPLKNKKSIQLNAELLDMKSDNLYPYTYDFKDIDIILFEGIFILKEPFIKEYDFKIWVDCSFETALQRALLRGQEGLPEEQVIHDYQTIYFAAQRIHFQKDNPQEVASLIIDNN
ncbi:MAG: uridine kinase [Microcystaceae cyanobacterium]